ncbi:hypothetical protein PIROE2DRAFT_1397 [Piromyces sp. E2]|nr:hypothetical protein PIROE2DRAFT_1397 [Piromyces sp. E2]|eukprot:OUM70518.1 hypothetical protein PIROE2DRAFT_1397 [Piromyces sp. E2]
MNGIVVIKVMKKISKEYAKKIIIVDGIYKTEYILVMTDVISSKCKNKVMIEWVECDF